MNDANAKIIKPNNNEFKHINVKNKNNTGYIVYKFQKRLCDIVLAMFALLLLSPIIIIISSFYFFGENKGPIFFKQVRVGLNGKEFYIYKFRSMVVNAEKILKSNALLYEKYINNSYKLSPEEDPRITKLGIFIRKTSLDELPQLINVLKGDMSLVGPRPVIKEELKEYNRDLNSFLSVKPGVTGYWQICGRSDVNYPERADLEFYYIYNQSIKFDLKILILTVFLVLTKKGAY
ncbi:sugar transferase [Priestia flexa]|uniref:sugar transferase n=1 Tax=Priestia flexa TaxID=86664 RepID=UPI003CFD8A12